MPKHKWFKAKKLHSKTYKYCQCIIHGKIKYENSGPSNKWEPVHHRVDDINEKSAF